MRSYFATLRFLCMELLTSSTVFSFPTNAISSSTKDIIGQEPDRRHTHDRFESRICTSQDDLLHMASLPGDDAVTTLSSPPSFSPPESQRGWQSFSSQLESPLFRLPLEMRYHIYAYILPEEERVWVRQKRYQNFLKPTSQNEVSGFGGGGLCNIGWHPYQPLPLENSTWTTHHERFCGTKGPQYPTGFFYQVVSENLF